MSEEIKIEKGVPIVNSPCKYPFGQMDVGDSILVSAKGYARAASQAYGSRNGKKFKTRSVEGGIRIWRVA